MSIMNFLQENEILINQIWIFTLSAMVVLYILCNVLPDQIVGKYLPLHNVFKPQTNVDLDYQSIGYALLHTTWATKITHSTIIIEGILWFVVFQSWHWSIPVVAIVLILIQSILIGDKKFGIFFVLMGALSLLAALFFIQYAGLENASLVAKVVLMLGGLMRMLSHSAEMIPPLLINNNDQFEKLTPEKINMRVLLSSPIGYVGEFGSSLPNRILPIQVNFIYQTIFGVKPEKTLPWKDVETEAHKVLVGGYSKLGALHDYYKSVTGVK